MLIGMRKILLALLAALVLPAALWAAGGDMLVTAPELPLQIKQFGAKKGADYWKVYAGTGDLLEITYGATDGDRVALCVLPPTVVTDFGVTDDQCLTRDSTIGQTSLAMTMNPTGYYTLVFGDGLCAPHNFATDCKKYGVAYFVSVTLLKYTETLLKGPSVAFAGARVKLTGTVRGAAGGVVEIQERVSGRPARGIGLARIGADGSFVRVVRLPVAFRGDVHYTALFHGDSEHRESSRVIRVRSIMISR